MTARGGRSGCWAMEYVENQFGPRAIDVQAAISFHIVCWRIAHLPRSESGHSKAQLRISKDGLHAKSIPW